MTRLCPACGTSLEHRTGRARWCSGACRQYVHSMGGPAALAETLRERAQIFRAMNGRGDTDAADFDQRAKLLEALPHDHRQEGVTT